MVRCKGNIMKQTVTKAVLIPEVSAIQPADPKGFHFLLVKNRSPLGTF